MQRVLFGSFALLICFFVLVPAFSPAALAKQKGKENQKDSVGEVLKNIRKYYQKAEDFSVDFVQTYHSKITKRTNESSGRVDFSKPMKMRWEYTKPDKKSFITDGKSLWIATWDNKEVKIHKDLKTSDLESSLAFLWGGENLAEKYKVARLVMPNVEGIVEVKHRLLLELVPKEKSQFDTLYLLLNPNTYRIEEVVLVDMVGNLNHLIFNSPQIQRKFDASHFVFKTPSKDWVETSMDY